MRRFLLFALLLLTVSLHMPHSSITLAHPHCLHEVVSEYFYSRFTLKNAFSTKSHYRTAFSLDQSNGLMQLNFETFFCFFFNFLTKCSFFHLSTLRSNPQPEAPSRTLLILFRLQRFSKLVVFYYIETIKNIQLVYLKLKKRKKSNYSKETKS